MRKCLIVMVALLLGACGEAETHSVAVEVSCERLQYEMNLLQATYQRDQAGYRADEGLRDAVRAEARRTGCDLTNQSERP